MLFWRFATKSGFVTVLFVVASAFMPNGIELLALLAFIAIFALLVPACLELLKSSKWLRKKETQ